MGAIISVTSGKGGVGKTFVSANMAAELASRGYRTLVFDADINCSNAFIMLHVKPGNLFQQYFEGTLALRNAILHSEWGVDVISAGINILRFMQLENEATLQRLVEDIEVLKNEYDFIIIDHAAGVNRDMLAFYGISDEVAFVANPEVTALTDLYRMIKVIATSGLCKSLNLIVNKVKNIDWAVNLYREIKAVMTKFGIPDDLFLLGPIVSDEEKVTLSIQKRTPLIELYPRTAIKGGFSLLVTRLLYKRGMIQGDDSKAKAFADFF